MGESNDKIAEVYRARARNLRDLAAKTPDPGLKTLRLAQAESLDQRAYKLENTP